ncbi:MAG: hypothetical protein QXI58_00835 [Candidatus Micrarchaeia archaeon]
MTFEEVKEHIKIFFTDFAERNRLLFREEFSDDQIRDAIKLGTIFYNSIPPITSNKFEDCLEDDQFLIVKLACAELLEMGAAYFVRNTLQTRTDVAVMDFEDKPPNYLLLANQLREQIRVLVQQRKLFVYLNSPWGVVHSPYYTYGSGSWII